MAKLRNDVLSIKCDHCSEVMKLRQIKLKKKDILILNDNKKLTLTYFECIKCGQAYHVIIDDEKTIEMFKRIRWLTKQLEFKVTNRAEQMVDYRCELQRLMTDFKLNRDALNKHYNKSFYQSGDLKEQLDISLPEALKNLD
jgi:hypothetical protein